MCIMIMCIVVLGLHCLVYGYQICFQKFFFSWIVTFAKVERCQITETCGINWEDSIMVEPIQTSILERFVSCGSPLMRTSTFYSNPVSNNLEQGLPNGIVTLLEDTQQDL